MKRAATKPLANASTKKPRNPKPSKVQPASPTEILVQTLDEWRDWLADNHETEEKVHLISFKKHTGKKSITHRQSLETALCYGWIDTTIKKIDEDKFLRTFVRRGDNANWSQNTLSYAKQLEAAGKMAPQGLLRYQQGLKKRPIDDGVPKHPEMPEQLAEALAKDEDAKENFNAFSASKKFSSYRFILSAKREQTRLQRAEKIVSLALENVSITDSLK